MMRTFALAVLLFGVSGLSSHAQENMHGLPKGKPIAMIDLATREGVQLVKGEWRYSDTKIIEVDFKAPGPEGQPTGEPVRTYDYAPHAGGADFDDSEWEVIDPTSLSKRRANGRICFNWYRIRLTVPEKIGEYNTTGSTIVFDTAVDDYAEIWIDGEIYRYLGQQGGSVVSGWNAPNRVVIARDAEPGRQIQLAIFGMNGPISNPPTNFIWLRYARLEFYPTESRGPRAVKPGEVNVEVQRNDPRMDAIVGPNPKIFKLAEGFQFTEGPVWVPREGALLFSDPNANRIYKYSKDGQLTVFKEQSGYSGADIADYRQPGSNGLTLDREGRLLINEHGNRRVSRIEHDGRVTVMAAAYEGKRFNSPNDLVVRSDGALFFTDPPFGLPKFSDDPRKELAFSGVYSLHNDVLRLLVKDLSGPNGIAFSPDERYLFVGNWDEKKKVVMRYEVRGDATIAGGELFYDLTSAPGEDAIDGIKVDREGNVYVSGPGGLWVFSRAGEHLGTIIAPMHVHNMTWGDDDGKTLYLCARSALYRMRLNIPGAEISTQTSTVGSK